MKVVSSMLVLIAFCFGLTAVTSSQRKQPAIRMVSSTLIDDVRAKLEKDPKTSPLELAQYANDLLAKKGIDFRFDLCEFIKRHNPTPRGAKLTEGDEAEQSRYRLPLKQADGSETIFETSNSEEQMEGLCGECFFSLPATRVTRQEMQLIAGDRKYHLVRPRSFGLDEMSLVDASMRRVLRTWQVPDQGEPLGVSSDGTKLYLQTEIDALILEISETSALRLLARDQVKLPKGEIVQRHPTDPKNAYQAFMRFRAGGRRLVIRYSAPCT